VLLFLPIRTQLGMWNGLAGFAILPWLFVFTSCT
jgi:hypothetical protein